MQNENTGPHVQKVLKIQDSDSGALNEGQGTSMYRFCRMAQVPCLAAKCQMSQAINFQTSAIYL